MSAFSSGSGGHRRERLTRQQHHPTRSHSPGGRVVPASSNLRPVDEIACAANVTPGQPACTRRDEHLLSCEHQRDGECPGCMPRPAVHGYLCRRHYEHWERSFTDLSRLRSLASELEPSAPRGASEVVVKINGEDVRRRRWNMDSGGAARAVQATSSSSTTAGPRVPLSSLLLDLDALDRIWPGDVENPEGAVAALLWAREVHTAGRRHPTEPQRERLRRVRCASCNQAAVVIEPPEIAGGDSTLRCVSCGWQTRDQDHAEAAALTEALIRDPYQPRRRTTTRVRPAPAGLERLAGIALLVNALR